MSAPKLQSNYTHTHPFPGKSLPHTTPCKSYGGFKQGTSLLLQSNEGGRMKLRIFLRERVVTGWVHSGRKGGVLRTPSVPKLRSKYRLQARTPETGIPPNSPYYPKSLFRRDFPFPDSQIYTSFSFPTSFFSPKSYGFPCFYATLDGRDPAPLDTMVETIVAW